MMTNREFKRFVVGRLWRIAEEHMPECAERLEGLQTEEEVRAVLVDFISPLLDELELIEAATKQGGQDA